MLLGFGEFLAPPCISEPPSDAITLVKLACLVRAPLIDFLPALEAVGPSILEFVRRPSSSLSLSTANIPPHVLKCEEVEAIGRAANLPLPENFAHNIYQGTIDFRHRVGGRHKPSALVDLETGRPLEIEVTVGSVLRMGRRVGLKEEEMKLLRLVYGLERIIQNLAVNGKKD